ncbi:MAG: hypothetical protein KZQ93_11365 [Candidatus Thiodiazotropha sp. (ex Monitilora ramsayi)]|nr:hypothetical protein [Candidatus Thiodiazotropha sp. (ex Monitilora ramsayi)]
MLPILLGLILAMLFGLMSFAVYGLEGLTEYAWIDTVFWSLILTGASITLINEVGRCLACRIRRWLRLSRFEEHCTRTPCLK